MRRWALAGLLLLIPPRLFAAPVRVVGTSDQSSRVHAELAVAGIATCNTACPETEAVLRLETDSALILFRDGSTRRVPLVTAEDCVRLAEILRARLLPIAAPSGSAPPPPPSSSIVHTHPSAKPSGSVLRTFVLPIPPPIPLPRTSEPPASPPAQVAAAFPRFELALLPTLSLQGGSPTIDLGVRARWFPSARIGLGLVGSIPLLPATYTEPEGRAESRAWQVGAELSMRVVRMERFSFGLSAGLTAMRLQVNGNANSPYPSYSSGTWLALPYVGLDASLRFAPHLAMTMGSSVGYALPGADVRVAERIVGHVAAPMVRLSLGIQYEY